MLVAVPEWVDFDGSFLVGAVLFARLDRDGKQFGYRVEHVAAALSAEALWISAAHPFVQAVILRRSSPAWIDAPPWPEFWDVLTERALRLDELLGSFYSADYVPAVPGVAAIRSGLSLPPLAAVPGFERAGEVAARAATGDDEACRQLIEAGDLFAAVAALGIRAEATLRLVHETLLTHGFNLGAVPTHDQNGNPLDPAVGRNAPELRRVHPYRFNLDRETLWGLLVSANETRDARLQEVST